MRQARIVLLSLATLAGLYACAKARDLDGGDTTTPPGDQPATGTGTATANYRITLTGAQVNADRKVEVTYRITDAAGAAQTMNLVDNRWTLAGLVTDPSSGLRVYESYVLTPATAGAVTVQQPNYENNGTVTDLGDGSFRYTFNSQLPAGYDQTNTLRVGVFSRRQTNTPDAGAAEYLDISDAVLDFAPDKTSAVRSMDLVSTESCNACHGILEAHGGFRRDARLCGTCHTSQLVDPDTADPNPSAGDPEQGRNSLDFGVMTHRIHMGRNLPTLEAAAAAGVAGRKYNFIGFRGTEFVFGETAAGRADPSKVEARGVAFPQDIRNCDTCHRGTSQAELWKSRPTSGSCGSCHDATWFDDPAQLPEFHTAHGGGAPVADNTCGNCHAASGAEFDISVPGAHTIPSQSSQANPLTFEITNVEGATAGAAPKVTFRVTNKDGSPVADLNTLNRLAITLAGPTAPDYQVVNLVTEVLVNAPAQVRTTLVPDANGAATYTFTKPLPATAAGTWAASIEGRRPRTINAQGGQPATFNEAGFNPVRYFAIGGGQAAPRRQVVTQQQCDSCHRALTAHGDLRHSVEYCLMCHAPELTDKAQRPATPVDSQAERSVHFKPMIHRIHTGSELELSKPYAIYGFGKTPHFFDEEAFPGDRARCATCHAGTTFTVDAVPADAPPTVANETPVTFAGALPAITSACLSCHDTQAAFDHAKNFVTGTGPAVTETCRNCHAESGIRPVTRSHGQ